jgi:hypothetical protein
LEAAVRFDAEREQGGCGVGNDGDGRDLDGRVSGEDGGVQICFYQMKKNRD